ncbi:hypothetical protein NPIL_280821 [Nephila pilipes]|uniref:Uncharacterized protein n=1 Tax=Nephila pilipes TaxID=299642 RepID=A0A8X6MDK2_NEPPI|nr:hypothetical protein NPIL_280821 [Nephila pilipes]
MVLVRTSSQWAILLLRAHYSSNHFTVPTPVALVQNSFKRDPNGRGSEVMKYAPQSLPDGDSLDTNWNKGTFAQIGNNSAGQITVPTLHVLTTSI